MNKRRDSTRVIYEILTLAKDGCSKTRLVYQANLNFKLADRYSQFLLDKELILYTPRPDGVNEYKITEKGSRFLHFLSKVEMELESPPNAPLIPHGRPSPPYTVDADRKEIRNQLRPVTVVQ